MRAQISCMPPIRGNDSSSVHRSEKPKWLPTCEYVAMPLGSSSDAPVIRPGPSRASSPAGSSVLFRRFPDAVRFHVVVSVVVVELVVIGVAAGFELVPFGFGVHPDRVEVVGRRGSPFGGLI